MFVRPRDPSPDHPILVEPYGGEVRVRAGGRLAARSSAAIKLVEANYPPFYYLPEDALIDAAISWSYRKSWSPYKGRMRTFHLTLAEGPTLSHAGWSFTEPRPAVDAIGGLLAFSPLVVDAVEIG